MVGVDKESNSLTVVSASLSWRKRADLTPEAFDRLLGWLGPDRESAGCRYEEIRSRLIKILVCRGCIVAEELADETINRVAGKIHEIAGTYVGNPALYFYGVAEKVFLEYAKKKPASLPVFPSPPTEEVEVRFGCLEQCMEHLSPDNQTLILTYYGTNDDSQRKIDRRKDLAARTGIGANALWIRAHRIRQSLRKCVSECIKGKQVQGNVPANLLQYSEES